MGLSVSVSGEGIRFEGKREGAWETLRFTIGADSAIVAEGSVGGQGGFSRVVSSPLIACANS